MTSIKRLGILKVEGSWASKSPTFSLLSSNKVLLSFNLSTSFIDKKEVELKPFQKIEIKIKDSLKTDLAGVILPLSVLKNSIQWVPLFLGNKAQTLEKIPDEVLQPRILVQVADQDYKQLVETSENLCDQHADTNESFTSEIPSMAEDLDSEDSRGLKSKNNKQGLILKILTKQLEAANEKAFQFQKKIENLELKLFKNSEVITSSMENCNEREKALLEVIQSKDSEIHSTLSTNMNLQSKIRVLENEKEHFLDSVSRMELEIDRLKELETELETANTKLIKSETIQDQLNKTLLKLSKTITENDEDFNYRSQILIKDQEIQMLKNVTEEVKKSGDMQIFSLKQEVDELKQKILRFEDQERLLAAKLAEADRSEVKEKNFNVVDNTFNEAMKKLKLNGCYTKLKDFTYQVQGKVVSVALCRGGLFARVGSSLVNLEEFLENIGHEERPDSSLTTRTDRTVENHPEPRIVRNSSQKTFFKSTQSSINKVRGVIDKSPLRDRNHVKSIDRRPFK